jgi:hypothetical protein
LDRESVVEVMLESPIFGQGCGSLIFQEPASGIEGISEVYSRVVRYGLQEENCC